MEYNPSDTEDQSHHQNHNRRLPKMSLLTMAAPSPPHTSFGRSSWDPEPRPSSDFATLARPRVDAEPIALPSIRQAFPELRLQPVDNHQGTSSTPTSATRALGPSRQMLTASPKTSSMATPEYVHSPSSSYKRQRLSATGEERDERFSQVPRLCTVPPHVERLERPVSYQRGVSPTYVASASSSPLISSASATPSSSTMDGWPGSRPSHHVNSSTSSTSTVGSGGRGLPGLPHMRYEHDAQPPMAQPARGGYASDAYSSSSASSNPSGYRYQHQHQHQHQQHAPPQAHGHHGHGPSGSPNPAYDAYQHHPSRMQSLSLGSIRGFDRAAFPAGMRYQQPQQPVSSPSGYHPREYVPVGEFGSLGLVGAHGMGGGNGSGSESKQRKRRGNLPKETTDKLRAWFVAHLHHPYPSEDEKQELMRQTGLQMNQISNWFINARRRQLPAMINNARVETDAISSSRSSSIGLGGVPESSHVSHSSSHHMNGGSSSSSSRHGHGHGHSSHHHSGHGGHSTHSHRMLPSPEHALPSPDRHGDSRQSAMYANDRSSRNPNRLSEQEFEDLPRRPKHMKRGSI